MDEEKREKLDAVERSLYSRIDRKTEPGQRTKFSEREVGVETEDNGWQSDQKNRFDELASKAAHMAQSKHSIVKKIFIASIVFFVLSVGVASFIFLDGVNFVSSKKVEVAVEGPLSIAGGQETSFDVRVSNNNTTDLESASLLVEYPEGTRSATDMTKPLERERFTLPNIGRGEEYVERMKAVFFGSKDKAQEIKITLEYRVENSSALFYKDVTHEFSISSSPVIVTPTYPKEVNSNQSMSFNIEVASNSKEPISNFLVNVEYPFGFVFSESNPKATSGNGIWQFATLKAGEKKTIRIVGTMVAQDNEERAFRITAGTADQNDPRKIAVPIAMLTESITVSRPFVNLDFLVEGKDQDYAASSNGQIESEVRLTNNLSTRLFNTKVEVSFSGAAFDNLAVSPSQSGFFQSFNNTIVWDKRALPDLGDLGPGESEELSFRLSPLDYSKIPVGVAASISMTAKVTGERVLDSGSSEVVTAIETRKIVLGSNVNFSSKTVRSQGSIENEGLVPPRVNKPTDYTIAWTVRNSINQISNIEVRAKLPPYVSYTGVKNPSGEVLSFDPNSHEVVWSGGSLLPQGSKTVYFQLRFVPSTSQIGSAPVLIYESNLSAIDKVTGAKLNIMAGAQTTNFSGDPSFKDRDDRVVE